MGIDVLNEKALRSDLVAPSLDQLRNETIPALQSAVDDSIKKAELQAQGAAQIDIDRLDAILEARLSQVAAILKNFVDGMQSLVDSLEGITATTTISKSKG